ncbi:aminoacyl tRNA synthase complex-interacting multifunctional protein [Anaeramoeba flamelloides]|uniref:Aminoacyl tRNA synthase complex-interacting multifunctional protein n=1 Tax=Anaeramoeba flamelloides TaxID=1746091 RepID=A0AAV7ZBS3_9EUKA|nr:aminoacyl tRNA synthase complex-interacting multifunctional protein [Anaeramoeba flamelloides]
MSILYFEDPQTILSLKTLFQILSFQVKYEQEIPENLPLPLLPALETNGEYVQGEEVIALHVATLKGKKNVSNWFGTKKDTRSEITQWTEFVNNLRNVLREKTDIKSTLGELNQKLSDRVFLINSFEPTFADLMLYPIVHFLITKIDEQQRNGFCNVTRYFNHLQNLAIISKNRIKELPLVPIQTGFNFESLIKPKVKQQPKKKNQNQKNQQQQQQQGGKGKRQKPTQEEIQRLREQKKKQQQQKKKQNQNNQQQQQKKKVEMPTDSFNHVNLQVGKIIKVENHPNADSLLIETIDFGEEQPRQVVSGIRKFYKHEELVGKLIVCITNLKKSKLRQVWSYAMILAASNSDHTQVEIIEPPQGSKVGERVLIGDLITTDPDKSLNPKRKYWKTMQMGLKTDESAVATFDGNPLKTTLGVCKAKSLTNCKIK